MSQQQPPPQGPPGGAPPQGPPQQRKPPPFHRFPPYAAILADPFIEGTDLGDGSVALAMKVLEKIGVNIVGQVRKIGKSAAGLEQLSDANLQSLFEVLNIVHQSAEIAEVAVQIEKPEQLLKLLQGSKKTFHFYLF